MNECLSFRRDSTTTGFGGQNTASQSYCLCGDTTWWSDQKKMKKKHNVDVTQARSYVTFLIWMFNLRVWIGYPGAKQRIRKNTWHGCCATARLMYCLGN